MKQLLPSRNGPADRVPAVITSPWLPVGFLLQAGIDCCGQEQERQGSPQEDQEEIQITVAGPAGVTQAEKELLAGHDVLRGGDASSQARSRLCPQRNVLVNSV